MKKILAAVDAQDNRNGQDKIRPFWIGKGKNPKIITVSMCQSTLGQFFLLWWMANSEFT